MRVAFLLNTIELLITFGNPYHRFGQKNISAF